MTQQRFTYQNRFGVRKSMITDDERPGAVTVHTEQDVEEILAGIARSQEFERPRGLNHKVATLPAIVVEDLINRGIFFDEDAFRRWLNGPEATIWRVWRGRV